jgi:intergrase/recombinase
MEFFLIVVGIPVICGIGYAAFERWLKHKEKMARALTAETAEKAAQYAAHTERLEQRVRVLERIVTDKGIVLAEEIEALRLTDN